MFGVNPNFRKTQIFLFAAGVLQFGVTQMTWDTCFPINNADMFRKMRALVSAGDIVIDAGANIGAVSVFWRDKVGLSGSVTAVEMMPDTAKRLRHNLSLNGLALFELLNWHCPIRQNARLRRSCR